MIYVSIPFNCGYSKKWPYNKVSHMFVGPEDDIEELHTFAEELGLKRQWFQNHPVLPHYDITVNKQRLAKRMGAKEVDIYEEGRIIKSYRERKIKSANNK